MMGTTQWMILSICEALIFIRMLMSDTTDSRSKDEVYPT